MSFLTIEAGGLPIGLWLALLPLAICLLGGVGGQTLSVVAWDKALAWRLQEDDPNSGDPMQRAFFATEWGVAFADAILQPIALALALYGIVAQHWTGLLGGTVIATILVYSGLFFFIRCYAVKLWRLGDWTHWRGTAIFYLILAETMGLIGFIGFWSNWRYFLG
jgi:hypothetical protein